MAGLADMVAAVLPVAGLNRNGPGCSLLTCLAQPETNESPCYILASSLPDLGEDNQLRVREKAQASIPRLPEGVLMRKTGEEKYAKWRKKRKKKALGLTTPEVECEITCNGIRGYERKRLVRTDEQNRGRINTSAPLSIVAHRAA